MKISCANFFRASAVALGILSAGNAMSQCATYDFTNATGWTQVNNQVTINAGAINFAGAADGSVARFVHATLPTPLSNTAWTCDFEFTPTGGNDASHVIVAFTESGTPVVSSGGEWINNVMMYSNTNCIQVLLLGTLGAANDPNTWVVQGMSKTRNPNFAYGNTLPLANAPVWSSSAGIPVNAAWGTTYFGRLQRLSPTQGMLTIFSDAARTTLVGQPQCFAIDAAVDNLSIIQSGNFAQGSTSRTLNGTVDNISVCNLNPAITGASSVCIPPSASYLYKLSNGNSSVTVNNGFPGSTGFNWTTTAPGSTIPNPAGTGFTSGSGNGNQTGITVGGSGTISCAVTYPCTTVTYTFAVTGTASPTSVITNSVEYCYGQTINVSGANSTNETQYQWGVAPCTSAGVVTGTWIFGNNTNGTAGIYNINTLLGLTGNCPGTLYFKVSLTTSNPACGSVTSYKVIKVVCPPAVSVSPNPAFLCPGGSTTLTASGASTYSWSPSAGLSCSNCSAPVASPAATTTYSVTGTSASGCASSAVPVTVNVSNLAVVARPDFSMCVDKNLWATPSGGTSPYSYNWSPSSGLLCSHAGLHTPGACPAPIISLNGPVSTTYTVTITDAAGCTATDVVVVTTDGCSGRMANPNGGSADIPVADRARIYPNPASHQVSINTGEVIAESIIITDALGREVFRTNPSAAVVEIGLDEFAAGFYSVQIVTGTETNTFQLVIEK